MIAQPAFRVGNLPVYGDTILAPMASFSDVPTRAIARSFGSAMHYTEFVPANALLQPPNPMWRRLDQHPQGEEPLVFQIFGSEPQELLAAAQRVAAWGADIIDINLGCSAKQVNQKGAGAALLRRPQLVATIFALLARHLPVPVTGKIRLGWDDEERNFLEIGRVMADNGAGLIAVHGRTRAQKYRGKADWEAIAALKQAVSVPVIGNGDVRTAADITALKAATGCDGVMIGRAAVGNPWIFARRERETLTFTEILTVIRRHLAEMQQYYGPQPGIVRFRPHLRRYFSGLPLKRFMQPLLEAADKEQFDYWLGVVETAVPGDEPLPTLQKRTWFPFPKT